MKPHKGTVIVWTFWLSQLMCIFEEIQNVRDTLHCSGYFSKIKAISVINYEYIQDFFRACKGGEAPKRRRGGGGKALDIYSQSTLILFLRSLIHYFFVFKVFSFFSKAFVVCQQANDTKPTGRKSEKFYFTLWQNKTFLQCHQCMHKRRTRLKGQIFTAQQGLYATFKC